MPVPTLLAYALGIVVAPRRAWSDIARGRIGLAWLCGYVVVLAALPLGAELIRLRLDAVPAAAAAAIALSGYATTLVGIAVLAGVAGGLARRFGGTGTMAQGLRLAAFAQTPAWLAGLFLVVPAIGSSLALAGTLYAIYVFRLGVGALMGIPPRRQLAYVVVVVVATLVLVVLLDLAAGLATGRLSIIGVPGQPVSGQPLSAKPG